MTPKVTIVVLSAVCVVLALVAHTLLAFNLEGDRRWPPGEIALEMQLGASGSLIDGSADWGRVRHRRAGRVEREPRRCRCELQRHPATRRGRLPQTMDSATSSSPTTSSEPRLASEPLRPLPGGLFAERGSTKW